MSFGNFLCAGKFRLCLVFFFFSITQFPSLITHHFKYYTHLAPSLNFHHSIFFTLFVSPIPVGAAFFFSFFLFSSTQTYITYLKKKKRKKKEPNNQPGEERKKKSQKWSKVVARYCLWVPYVCLITILSLSYELWKLKTAKMCFQFP